jgi:hypothetical protein
VSFGFGLSGLAVSPVFEVAAPRWFILSYGAACALLALLAPFLSGSWQQLQTEGRPVCGFPMGEDETALWATEKEVMACFSSGQKTAGSSLIEAPLRTDMNRP